MIPKNGYRLSGKIMLKTKSRTVIANQYDPLMVWLFVLSIIFPENRYPLFGITL